jgi:hypothetical protein
MGWQAESTEKGFRLVPDGEPLAFSAYWRAVDRFLYTNDDEHLHPFEGEGVFDVRSRFYQFETRPNVLRKLESLGDLNFIEIYAQGGGKPHALGLGVAALAVPAMEVICRVPKRYKALDVRPSGSVLIYEIEDRFEPEAYF